MICEIGEIGKTRDTNKTFGEERVNFFLAKKQKILSKFEMAPCKNKQTNS